MSCSAGAGSPVMLMVPSTLPVGPLYGGSFFGFTNASTLALGIGVPFTGAVGVGANAVASFAAALAPASSAALGESFLQPVIPSVNAAGSEARRAKQRIRRVIVPC